MNFLEVGGLYFFVHEAIEEHLLKDLKDPNFEELSFGFNRIGEIFLDPTGITGMFEKFKDGLFSGDIYTLYFGEPFMVIENIRLTNNNQQTCRIIQDDRIGYICCNFSNLNEEFYTRYFIYKYQWIKHEFCCW